jgi:hypothetical protein
MSPTPPENYGVIWFSDSRKLYFTENQIYTLFFNDANPPNSWHEWFMTLTNEYNSDNKIIYYHDFDEEIKLYDENTFEEFITTPRKIFLYENNNQDNIDMIYLLRFSKFSHDSTITCSIRHDLNIIDILQPLQPLQSLQQIIEEEIDILNDTVFLQENTVYDEFTNLFLRNLNLINIFR